MFSLSKIIANAEKTKLLAQLKADGASDLSAIVEGIFTDLEAGKSPTVIGLDVLAKVKADAVLEYQKSLVVGAAPASTPASATPSPAIATAAAPKS